MRIAKFIVPGRAQTKGSWKSINGRLVPDNKKSKPYEKAVAAAAFDAYCYEGSPRPLLQGGVVVKIVCYFRRPKSHYRTGRYAHLLKDTSPRMHVYKPDCDKLARNILDAMTGVVYRDDSQVVGVKVSKVYDDRERTEVMVYAKE